MSLLFHGDRKILIGVVHLGPLPGAPRWQGTLDPVLRMALRDAGAFERGGADAIIIENFGDAPFAKSAVGPETVAAMAVIGRLVRDNIRLPIGFNVLRNDPKASLALCAACDGKFIRVNVHTGAMLTDQGIIEGNAYETLRCRENLGLDAEILADVHVKHASPLGSQRIEDAARDTLERGLADALIVSGTGTGVAPSLADLEAVRSACPAAKILIGSGVTIENASEFLVLANGVIVGSSLKEGGCIKNAVDPVRVEALTRVVRGRAPR